MSQHVICCLANCTIVYFSRANFAYHYSEGMAETVGTITMMVATNWKWKI